VPKNLAEPSHVGSSSLFPPFRSPVVLFHLAYSVPNFRLCKVKAQFRRQSGE